MDTTIYKDTLNKIYNSVVWTHKIQRTYLEVLEMRRKVLSIISIVFTSASSISTTLFAIFDSGLGTIISSMVIIISLVISEILDKIETKSDVEKFKLSSERLFSLKNEMMVFGDEINSNKIPDEIVKIKIEIFSAKFEDAVSNLRTVPDSVVKRADFKLKDRHDEEVDFKLL